MKTKSFIFASLCIILCTFNACEEPISPNPFKDTTKLWPAPDSTGKCGYINEKGEMIIPAQYDYAHFFSGDVAAVYTYEYTTHTTKLKTQFINKKGKIIYTLPDDEFSYNDEYFFNGYYLFKKNEYWGFYDTNFNVVIPAQYDMLSRMDKEGLALFRGGYQSLEVYNEGFINRNRDTLLYLQHMYPMMVNYDNYPVGNFDDYCYYSQYGFLDGRMIVKKYTNRQWKYGAINTKGELIIDTIYDALVQVGNGLLAYKNYDISSDKYGLMDMNGYVIKEPSFYEIGIFGDNDMLPVRSDDNGKWGYVDKTGTIKIEPIFSMCQPFCEGVSWIMIGNKYGLINLNGIVQWFCDGTPYTCSHNGLLAIFDRENGVFKYVDHNNKTIYSCHPRGYSSTLPYLMSSDPSVSPLQEQEKQMLHMFLGTDIYPLMKLRYEQ